MLHKLCLLVAIASITVTSSVLACNGDACKDISIKTDGRGCVMVQNRGMRAVRVRLGYVGFTVRGGETFYPKETGGNCVARYLGSESATYAESKN